jgi:hypothetical protein
MSTNAFTSSQDRPLTNPPSGVQGPSCDSDHEGWTLDQGGLPDWLRAIRTCVTAWPLIQLCWETRNRLYAESHPAGVIWAGTAYTETGEPLLTQQALVEYANWRRRQQAAPSAPAARAA